MKNITKSITGTIIGTVVLMLAACSSNPSTAPEASAAIGQEDSSKQIRLEPTDSTSVPLTVSADDEATLERWLNGNPISNGITVDNWCYPEDPDDPFWCLPYRIQLEKGTVANVYGGSINVIMCETETDTISYSVSLHKDVITKTWTNPLFDTEAFSQSKTQFKQSCKAEGGDITEETETKIACDIKIEPSPSQDDPSGDSRIYFKPHYFYNYIDLSWTKFATKSTEACRVRPEIEPKP